MILQQPTAAQNAKGDAAQQKCTRPQPAISEETTATVHDEGRNQTQSEYGQGTPMLCTGRGEEHTRRTTINEEVPGQLPSANRNAKQEEETASLRKWKENCILRPTTSERRESKPPHTELKSFLSQLYVRKTIRTPCA